MNDPQQLNMYGYGRNNPLRFGDDDGRDVKEKVIQTTYTVHGATAAEAQSNAKQTSGIKTETGEPMAGLTSAQMQVVNKTVSTETSAGTAVTGFSSFTEVKSADVQLTVTIKLPTWAEKDKASPQEQSAWDQSVASLEEHEKGHEEIARQGAEKLDKAIPGTTGYGTGQTPDEAQGNAAKQRDSKVRKKIEQSQEATAQQQQDYDKKTDHGRAQP